MLLMAVTTRAHNDGFEALTGSSFGDKGLSNGLSVCCWFTVLSVQGLVRKVIVESEAKFCAYL